MADATAILFTDDVGRLLLSWLDDITDLARLLITCQAGQMMHSVAERRNKLATAALTSRGARWLVQSAARRGDVRLLDWALLSEKVPDWPWPTEIRRSVPLLITWDGPFQTVPHILCGQDLMRIAAEGGHLAVMRWLRARQPPYSVDEEQQHQVGIHVGSVGDFQMVQFLDEEKLHYALASALCPAARNGHLPFIRWVLEDALVRAYQEWDDEFEDRWFLQSHAGVELLCDEAAAGGHLHVLRWLRAQKPPYQWGELTCYSAAQHGHVDVLHWLRAQHPPCPWGAIACVEVLGEWLLEKQFHVKRLLREFSSSKDEELVEMAEIDGGHHLARMTPSTLRRTQSDSALEQP